jgi:hypothetical protein
MSVELLSGVQWQAQFISAFGRSVLFELLLVKRRRRWLACHKAETTDLIAGLGYSLHHRRSCLATTGAQVLVAEDTAIHLV